MDIPTHMPNDTTTLAQRMVHVKSGLTVSMQVYSLVNITS